MANTTESSPRAREVAGGSSEDSHCLSGISLPSRIAASPAFFGRERSRRYRMREKSLLDLYIVPKIVDIMDKLDIMSIYVVGSSPIKGEGNR